MKKLKRYWEIPLAVFILVSLISLAHADSGSEAYCKCKGSASLDACLACCKTDCHDTNWGGDFWGLCTNRCQKNCDLYGSPTALSQPLPDDVAAACAAVTATQAAPAQ